MEKQPVVNVVSREPVAGCDLMDEPVAGCDLMDEPVAGRRVVSWLVALEYVVSWPVTLPVAYGVSRAGSEKDGLVMTTNYYNFMRDSMKLRMSKVTSRRLLPPVISRISRSAVIGSLRPVPICSMTPLTESQ